MEAKTSKGTRTKKTSPKSIFPISIIFYSVFFRFLNLALYFLSLILSFPFCYKKKKPPFQSIIEDKAVRKKTREKKRLDFPREISERMKRRGYEEDASASVGPPQLRPRLNPPGNFKQNPLSISARLIF